MSRTRRPLPVSVRGSSSAAALTGVAFTWSRSRLRGRGQGRVRTRREDAELAGHLPGLAHAPVFSDAAVPDAEEVLVRDRHAAPGWRDAGEDAAEHKRHRGHRA